MISLIAVVLCSVAVIGKCKDPPIISPNFMANTNEVDENNVTIVEQRLVFDIDLRRSMMYAEGSLVKGAMQQIKRCDIHPSGWFSSAGGPNPKDPSTWTCTNMTIDLVGELPMNCQYSTFWNFPEDMKYTGPTVLNGVECDQWVYLRDGGEYAFWSTTRVEEDGSVTDVPVANGKIKSVSDNVTGKNLMTTTRTHADVADSSSLYIIFYLDFIPGTPADDEYAPVEGCDCPASTPP